MSTFTGRSASALVVIDVQKDVFSDACKRDEVVANIASLVDQAREAGAPVVWVQHSDDELEHGSDGWHIVDELEPREGEPIVEKHYGDTFEATDFEEHLARLAVAELIVTGGETDACVRSTIHGAFTRGYDVTLVGDAHSTSDLSQWVENVPTPAQVIVHTNAYWSFQGAPGRVARVVPTAEVTFEPQS